MAEGLIVNAFWDEQASVWVAALFVVARVITTFGIALFPIETSRSTARSFRGIQRTGS